MKNIIEDSLIYSNKYMYMYITGFIVCYTVSYSADCTIIRKTEPVTDPPIYTI